MFNKNSRYDGLSTVTVTDKAGREVKAVKLRRLPSQEGLNFVVQDNSQLDVMSEQQYNDGEKYWHIADANTELEANELVRFSNRTIKVPKN